MNAVLLREQRGQVFRRVVRHQTPAGENQDFVADGRNLGQDVAGKDDGVVFAELPNQLANLDDLSGVETRGGLIQYDHLRVADQRLRNADALAIALGKIANQPVFHLGYPRALHGGVHLLSRLRARKAPRAGDKAQIFRGRHVGVQRRNLRQITDALFCFQRLFKDVVPVDRNLALRGGKAAGDDVHRGRFARAVRPEKPVYLALLNGEAYVGYGGVRAVSLGQVTDRDQCPRLP